MRSAVAAAVVTIALVIAGFAAAPAAAHATVLATDPGENAELAQLPTTVSATFSEPMQRQFAAMTVVGPGGELWSTGEPQVQDTVIGIGVRPLGPSGTYTVNYRATSADGHVVNGSWSFRVNVGTDTPTPAARPAPPAPSEPPPTATTGRALPVWPFLVGAIAVVAAGAAWAVRRRT